MLSSLRIKNFALIDQLELDLHKGFTALTGETGSGKSILLNALNLIMGERADFSVIGPLADKSVVEAGFNITDLQLEDFFVENDLDYDPNTIIRREISRNGKSRSFVNDTPVGLTTLRTLTEKLISIHSQYNTLELKNKNYQLNVLDTLTGLKKRVDGFTIRYNQLLQKNRQLDDIQNDNAKSASDQDYIQFQLNELAQLSLDSIDYTALEREWNILENSEDLLKIYSALSSSVEENISPQMRDIKTILDKLSQLDPTIGDLTSRWNSTLIELEDIANEASSKLESIENDPQRKFEIDQKLNVFNSILNKYNVKNQGELLQLQQHLTNSITKLADQSEEIQQLQHEIDRLRSELQSEANELHEQRVKEAVNVEKTLEAILYELKLPHTRLQFDLYKSDELNKFGNSSLELLFSANVGIPAVPIEKAASGGELSRVMLALQKMISEKQILPTVLFDEIDTGVSGDVAQKIGDLLNKMGANFQLLAITHLPQVAARASHHFKVEKSIQNDRANSSVRILSQHERVEEIARLMSGEEISLAAIENAKALMS